MTYLNVKTEYGTETIDHLDKTEYPSFKEFKKDLKETIKSYALMGYDVYISQRACKGYQNN